VISISLRKISRLIMMGLVLMALSLGAPLSGKADVAMENCSEIAYSTSEDFVSPEPLNTTISDGDLLGANCTICARNADLLAVFDVDISHDLGLDAVDVIDVDGFLVAFSTELDSSNLGQFKAGDLLTTHGHVIPNQALTYAFNQGAIQVDLGLDAVHFIGAQGSVIDFLEAAARYTREDWLTDPGMLGGLLDDFSVDIWYSTEGTPGPAESPLFLDGDVLSALSGKVEVENKDLLPIAVPAGIPDRGVDFGLDALTSIRTPGDVFIHFSTELLFANEPNFSDGDVLLYGNGPVITNPDLLGCFNSQADMLGLDALYLGNIPTNSVFLPLMQGNQQPE
jgi:hypothetical protein